MNLSDFLNDKNYAVLSASAAGVFAARDGYAKVKAAVSALRDEANQAGALLAGLQNELESLQADLEKVTKGAGLPLAERTKRADDIQAKISALTPRVKNALAIAQAANAAVVAPPLQHIGA